MSYEPRGYRPKRFFRRFEVWMIIVAIAVSLLFALGGCAPSNDMPQREPDKQSDVLRKFRIGWITVAEFRDSSGRICVLATGPSSDSVALDCARLAPLDYEQLPE